MTDLLAEIGTLPEILANKAADVLTAEGQRKASISERDQVRRQLETLISKVRRALAAGFAPKEQYDLCNLNYPSNPAAAYIPNDPSDLSVVGSSNSTNRARFSGNNKNNFVHYEIWRRVGDTGQWTFLRSISKQSFVDSPVTPGQYYEYKVRTVAKQGVSNFSNSALVYGI
jgi:hypothetical protein